MQILPLVTPFSHFFKLTLGDTLHRQICKYFLSILLALIKIVITVYRHLYGIEQMFSLYLVMVYFPFFVPDQTEKPRGCLKKTYDLFCGLQKTEPKLTKEEEEVLKKKLTDTSEEPFWRNVMNTNAIVLLAVAVFFYGYFG